MSIVSNTLFMRLALDAAYEEIKQRQSPFGACIVKNNTVITCNYNSVFATCDITAHAEITAIRTACKKLQTINLHNCIIYSTYKPCPMCFGAIHWAGIKHIIYGTSIEDAQELGFSELPLSVSCIQALTNSPITIQGHVLYQENKKLFAVWQQQFDSRYY